MISHGDKAEIDLEISEALDQIGFDHSGIDWKVSDAPTKSGMRASYNPNTKTILVSDKLNKKQTITALAHEYVHAIRIESDDKLLTSQDLEDLLNTTNDYELKKVLAKLASYFTVLSRVWTNEEAVDSTADKIDGILESLAHLKMSDMNNENADTWKWLSKNYDGIYDLIDYYSVGGHDDKWFYWKDKLEKSLGFEIPVAE